MEQLGQNGKLGHIGTLGNVGKLGVIGDITLHGNLYLNWKSIDTQVKFLWTEKFHFRILVRIAT